MDYLLLLSSIVLGALSVFLFRLYEPRFVKLLNAFTGAYLLSLTFLHLLPELYHPHEGALPASDLHIGVLILSGFFIQVALDVISMGVEHGHAHHLHGGMPVGVVSGLCLHAFIEAMALGNAATHYDPASRRLLLYSIVLHNFPVSIALLGMLLQTGMKRGSALAFLGLFAAMAPLGMSLSAHTALAGHTRELMAVVIGIFMHISTTILFESSDIHRFNFAKLAAILVGTGLAFLSLMLH
ncbi:MAG TPA: ZIP family metal transporter [Candidatus Acidoferrum sp.]|jgi:zinc and cadmium transporter|nr:ZIP family metal transporter [Candidatus Acidoferrum sp.]